jgi:hypothetical protein
MFDSVHAQLPTHFNYGSPQNLTVKKINRCVKIMETPQGVSRVGSAL